MPVTAPVSSRSKRASPKNQALPLKVSSSVGVSVMGSWRTWRATSALSSTTSSYLVSSSGLS